MSRYCAEILNGIVQRVIVTDSLEWCQQTLGGEWVETFLEKNSPRYAGIGYRYDATYQQFFPWGHDTATGTLWVLASEWDALSTESQQAFLEYSSLPMCREIVQGTQYVVFGGVITDEIMVALGEVLG